MLGPGNVVESKPSQASRAYNLSGKTDINQMTTQINVCLQTVVSDKEMCSEMAKEEVLK